MAKSVASRVILCLSVLRQTSEMLRACVHAKSIQSYPTLCDPMSCTPPDSSAHGILQARILEWVAMPSSRGSSWPGDWTCGSFIAGGFFTVEPLGKPLRLYFVLFYHGFRVTLSEVDRRLMCNRRATYCNCNYNRRIVIGE